MNEYQEQILDNFKNPRNFGNPQWNPSTSQQVQNVSCGDEIEVFILLDNNIISDIKFVGRGCSISIASASLLTEEFKGKETEYALEFSEDDLKNLLGIPLTTSRLVCATLALEAIKAALKVKSPTQ